MISRGLKRWRFLSPLAAAVGWVCLATAPLTAQTVTITNTATVDMQWGSAPQKFDASVDLLTLPPPTPSEVRFFQYAPGSGSASPVPVDGTRCANGSDVPEPLTKIADLAGNTIELTSPPLVATDVYHAGEPVFVTLEDLNRNVDSTVREFVEVRLSSDSGDEEILQLQETGPNTGLFAGAIPSGPVPPPAAVHDCRLSAATDGTLRADYTDLYYPTDTAEETVLIDPFGIVFDSSNGNPVDGATVTLIDNATGRPAVVLGDDGTSAFPGSVVTGGTATDSGGQLYDFPPGGFRFPFIAPGDYVLRVVPPMEFVAPSTVPLEDLAEIRDPGGDPYSIVAGSLADVFTVSPGPAIRIDVPVDPLQDTLLIEKSVSLTEASAGDFLQYRLTVENLNTETDATNVVITDTLPFGFRYEEGSLRIGGTSAPDPEITDDGRTLSISVGTIPATASVEASYIVRVGTGARKGQAVNRATANGDGGVVSNTAEAAVKIREPFFTGGFPIIGRVLEGDCDDPWEELKGVGHVRVLMDNGAYSLTDPDGQYHFEGVRPGTHVVQLDLDSLPPELEPVSCIQNTRFAGRSFSQFVEVQEGGLWRADFYVRPRAPREGVAGLRLQSTFTPERLEAAPIPRKFTFRALFDTLGTRISEEKQRVLDQLVEHLRALDIERIEAIGHTDNVPIAPHRRNEYADNQALSEARARATADYIAGMLSLPPDKVTIAGRGEREPVADNRTEGGRELNRRIELMAYAHEAAPSGPVVTGGRFRYRVEVDGSSVPVGNLRISVMLPEGVEYVSGSSTLDGIPIEDPTIMEQIATFRLGDPGIDWKRVIEFSGRAGSVPVPAQPNGPELHTFRGNFETLEAELRPEGVLELDALVEAFRGTDIERVEVTGHTDSVRIAPAHRDRYPDNYALSRARARTVADVLARELGLKAHQIDIGGRGPDNPVADNRTEEGRARNRRVEVWVYARNADGSVTPLRLCNSAGLLTKTVALFDTDLQTNIRTEPVENDQACSSGQSPVFSSSDPTPETWNPGGGAGFSAAEVTDADSGRKMTPIFGRPGGDRPLPSVTGGGTREIPEMPDDVTAAGGATDWLREAAPGIAWLFPPTDHNPRSPVVRVVIQHAPGQTVVLTQAGVPVDPILFDGVETDVAKAVSVSIWRGIPIFEGTNSFEAVVRNPDGSIAAEMTRTVHYANQAARAELVREASVLVADGVNEPVIAVRILDRQGRPVRSGVSGTIEMNPPYLPAQTVEEQQERQLAGLDRFKPLFVVDGDEGIARIRLVPTHVTGEVVLNFSFQDGADTRGQELRVWLSPVPRDWVIVGFAQGTVGYQTLSGNMAALDDLDAEEDVYTDGQVSLYAKGRVLGKWLLTLAYDTDKPDREENLFSTIDPDEFYTLYGDGTETRHDAESREKIYLKLERSQFYALFGDYETGLTQTQLSRYNRRLTGGKTEYKGEVVELIAFAAETELHYTRDEIQGNGTSGLYHLSNGNIVLNSEQVRIETRDRFQSERIIETRTLARHLDYDIDYDAGTLFFREPIHARDADFNPVFIVVEYETFGATDRMLNGGGRIGASVLDGRVRGGISYIRDESVQGKTDLGGVDARFRLGPDTELRLEGAWTDGRMTSGDLRGDAERIELEHHAGRFDGLAYFLRQDPEFGLNQQNASEAGMTKAGLDYRFEFMRSVGLRGQFYRQENLVTDDARNAANARIEYRTDRGGVYAGGQVVRDEASNGDLYESRQATLGASRNFLEKKLEVQALTELSLGGRNESVDFPTRYQAGAGYQLTESVRLTAAQEYTNGGAFDSFTTRAGLQVVPWNGAQLNSTLNQSRITEYGPRTFGQLGLTQAILIGKRWGIDLSAESSHTFNESVETPPVINADHPIASGGAIADGSLTDDFTAFSGGATYRSEPWSWNGRAETRNGRSTDRYGLVTGFLRQARAGVAFSASARLFRTEVESGPKSTLATADLSWAFRPLGGAWALLDRFELRYDAIENGTGKSGGGLNGNNTLNVAGDARSRRLVNNFTLNRVSRAWTAEDRKGNLFQLNQRNQWSLFYGAKYVLDRFDGKDYSGFTDLLGLEWRFDLTRFVDLGVHGHVLHAWGGRDFAYSYGPMIGFSPLPNAWITLGFNAFGFRDRDFDAAEYTAQGVYLQLRIKFDQNTPRDIERWKSENPGPQKAPAATEGGTP